LLLADPNFVVEWRRRLEQHEVLEPRIVGELPGLVEDVGELLAVDACDLEADADLDVEGALP